MALRFKPNRAQKDDYISKMAALTEWLNGEGKKYHAKRALTGTVYFTINGQRYRVASHKPGVNYTGEINYHAAPTRAPAIAAALAAGKQLNGKGMEV